MPRPRTGGTDSVTHTVPEIESTTSTLQDVLQAIAASRTALEVKIDTLSIDQVLLQDDHKRLAERVTTTERDLADANPTLALTNNRLNTIDNHLKLLENRVEERDIITSEL
ncbi:hypothetical protein NDU88_005996 [Pleurodeles waltl]|uniref:Uncharacterized protein n=1 Tax=Pleurodeles waltl TaxID=8319 RepID=A0AAV7MAY7_PLEWA|nr:hypothetical protein NDU88_005996 [Pleurodeles waltl]